MRNLSESERLFILLPNRRIAREAPYEYAHETPFYSVSSGSGRLAHRIPAASPGDSPKSLERLEGAAESQ